jgi:hypothetical protein
MALADPGSWRSGEISGSDIGPAALDRTEPRPVWKPVRICTKGHDIRSPETWMTHAPPKKAEQQKVGRSAWELAKAWCDNLPTKQPPPAIVRLLEQYTPLVGATYECFEPECKVRFDTLRGEPRNTELAGTATARSERIAITGEALRSEKVRRKGRRKVRNLSRT